MRILHSFIRISIFLLLTGCASTKNSTDYYFPPDTTVTDYPAYYPNISPTYSNPAFFNEYYSGNYLYNENISLPARR